MVKILIRMVRVRFGPGGCAILAFWILSLGIFGAARAQDGGGDPSDVNEPGQLEELAIGQPDAPVTVVEYASLTCPHCARFHTSGLDHLKKTYVADGKVRIVFRDFPLDNFAFGAALLARCSEAKKAIAIQDLLYAQQDSWLRSANPWESIQALLIGSAGYTPERIEACIARKDLFDGLRAEYVRASRDLAVNSTPTLFINGERYPGALGPQELDAIIEPLLAAESGN